MEWLARGLPDLDLVHTTHGEPGQPWGSAVDAGGYWAYRSCGVMQVEGTIVLFRDADSLEMPRLLSR